MCKRGDDRMDPLLWILMRKTVEMSDNFTDMTPEYISEVGIGSVSAGKYDGIHYPNG